MIKTVNMIDVSDWDTLVENTYGRPYSFQQQDGCKERGSIDLKVPTSADDACDYPNDTIPEVVNGKEMGVSFKAWIERDPKAPIADRGTTYLDIFWHRNFYPNVESVAYDLYKKGLLPAGNYIIDIDW